MRARKSCSLSQASAAATTAACGDSANPGTPAGNPSDTSMPRADSIWRTISARPFASPSAKPSARPSARLWLRRERSSASSSGPVPSRAHNPRPNRYPGHCNGNDSRINGILQPVAIPTDENRLTPVVFQCLGPSCSSTTSPASPGADTSPYHSIPHAAPTSQSLSPGVCPASCVHPALSPSVPGPRRCTRSSAIRTSRPSGGSPTRCSA